MSLLFPFVTTGIYLALVYRSIRGGIISPKPASFDPPNLTKVLSTALGALGWPA